MLTQEKLNIIVADIKRKKELAELSDAFLLEKVILHLQKNQKLTSFLEEKCNPKSAVYKETIKRIREQLRRSYGLFHPHQTPPEILLHWSTTTPKEQSDLLNEILKTHSSTKERLTAYPSLYKRIFDITGKPSSILDLACGLNPFSLS